MYIVGCSSIPSGNIGTSQPQIDQEVFLFPFFKQFPCLQVHAILMWIYEAFK